MFCKNCGKEISDDAKFCDGCGTSVGGANPANTNNKSNDFEKYLLLARRSADSDNNADAAKYYGLAQTENPNDWESLFYGTYYTAMQTNIAGIASSANLVVGAIEPTVSLIKNHVPESEQVAVATQMVDSCKTIATMLFEGAKNNYNGIDSSIQSRFTGEYRNRAFCARSIALVAAALIENIFNDDERFDDIIAGSYKHAFTMYESNRLAFEKDSKQEFSELIRIAKYDKEFAAQRLQPRIKEIDSSIKNLSNPTTNGGCGGFFGLIGIVFIILTRFVDPYLQTPFYIIGFVFVAFGILCFIPFKKSEKRLAQDAERIKKLEAEKAEIENLIN